MKTVFCKIRRNRCTGMSIRSARLHEIYELDKLWIISYFELKNGTENVTYCYSI